MSQRKIWRNNHPFFPSRSRGFLQASGMLLSNLGWEFRGSQWIFWTIFEIHSKNLKDTLPETNGSHLKIDAGGSDVFLKLFQ